MATTPLQSPPQPLTPPRILRWQSRVEQLAKTHAAIWWLHDAPDYDGLEAAARELVTLALPDLSRSECRQTAAAIRLCYECYDTAQGYVRSWDLRSHRQAERVLEAAHIAVREIWEPESAGLEEGYFAFFAHSMWLHAPGWQRPVQKLWRNPARLAGLWRYHRASFGATHPDAVRPAVEALFWAGLAGHDYKSREAAETHLVNYWALLDRREIRHLFF